MLYDRLTCYFLSGTGNSYRAARWLTEAVAEEGTKSETVPIAVARPAVDLQKGARQLVGLYHPAHGLMPPWSMIKFILRLPRGRGAHAVVVSTRGAIPLGPVMIPGATGLALFFPVLVLLLKGYRVRGALGLDMPVNMLNLHWGMTERNAGRVVERAKRRHQRLVSAVLAKKHYWHPLNLIWELAWCIPFVFWPFFPIAYLLIGRIFMAKLMFADTSCKGCGRCARNCPCQAIKMVGAKPKTPFWTHRCEVCMRCMGYCKFKSVQASHLWLVPVLYGTSLLTASSLQWGLMILLDWPVQIVGLANRPIHYALTALALPLFYYLFFGLQRIKPLRTMFTYTTLTKLYRRRYHEPDTEAREMNRRSDS